MENIDIVCSRTQHRDRCVAILVSTRVTVLFWLWVQSLRPEAGNGKGSQQLNLLAVVILVFRPVDSVAFLLVFRAQRLVPAHSSSARPQNQFARAPFQHTTLPQPPWGKAYNNRERETERQRQSETHEWILLSCPFAPERSTQLSD